MVDSLRDRILRTNAAYTRGERAFIVDLLHERIDWRMNISPETLPVPNHVIGRWHVIEAWRKIDAELELLKNDIVTLVVEGDRAAVIYDRTLRVRKTGRAIRLKVAAFHRYENNKLIECQEFGDGLELLEQTIGRSIDAPLAYGSLPA